MKHADIGKLIGCAAVLLAIGVARADAISFGDTYLYFEASWPDGWSEYEMKKVGISQVYTGSTVQSPSRSKQYALFEVIGANSKSDVLPIVENLGFDGTLTASVWTDAELMQRAMPAASTAGDWETGGRSIDHRGNDSSGDCLPDYDDDMIYEYESERSKKFYEWPSEVWPDNKAVPGRFWVAVECTPSASRRWYGLEGSIRVWQSGTSVKSEQFYISYCLDDAWPFVADAKGLFRNISIDTKFVCLSAEVWDIVKNFYDSPLHGFWLESSARQEGAPLKLTLPEAGILYMSASWGYDLEDIIAKNADSQSLEILRWDDDKTWDLYEEIGAENFYYDYGIGIYGGSPGCLTIKVNSKRTITLEREDTDDDFDFDRLQFFPNSTKAVAVEASYFSIFDNNRYERYSGQLGEYLQGYVTGTGVYKVGEKVSLTAVPAPGEAFDHWELKYGDFPGGIDTTKPTLSFTVTDACAGTAEERKQMVVKAVWKSKRQIIATTEDPAHGVATGSGFYHDGDEVTIAAKSTVRYQFKRWSDGPTNTTRQVYVGDDAEYVAEFEQRDMPQFDVIAGNKGEYDLSLPAGYAAKGLPTGLSYNAKTGKVTGTAKKEGEYEVTFSKAGEEDFLAMFTVRAEVASVGCEGLSAGTFVAGVAGNADGIPLEIDTETGVKSVTVTKLPAGMKYDAKSCRITGAPTKAGNYTAVITLTTTSGAKVVENVDFTVAALPDAAVGIFNGFVKADDGIENAGTFQLATTDAGKLTAKVTTAAGSYSFSGACWDSVNDEGVYSATLATKKNEVLTLALDSTAGWDKNQLTGTFSVGGVSRVAVARKNAFGKTWNFNAVGNETDGWTLSYAENAKTAALTVTLNADGSTKIAGKLGTLSASASGYADVTGLAYGVIYADFAPVVSIKDGKSTFKRALSIRANLWFDRSNNHPEGVGTAKVVDQ